MYSAIFCKLDTPSCGFVRARTFLGEPKRCWRFPVHGNFVNTTAGLQSNLWVPIDRAPGSFSRRCFCGSGRELSRATINRSRDPGTVTEGCTRRVPPFRAARPIHGERQSPEGNPEDPSEEDGYPRRSCGSAGAVRDCGRTVLEQCWDSLRLS